MSQRPFKVEPITLHYRFTIEDRSYGYYVDYRATETLLTQYFDDLKQYKLKNIVEPNITNPQSTIDKFFKLLMLQ